MSGSRTGRTGTTRLGRLLVALALGASTLAVLAEPASALAAPSITQQPGSLSGVPQGATAGFTAKATNDPASTVVWQKDVSGTWTNQGGSISTTTSGTTTTSTITLTATSGTAGTYRAVFTNSEGTATTSSATLSVQPSNVAPSITQQPTDQTVYLGNWATFSVGATGVPSPSYQWWVGTTVLGVTTWNSISGATSSSYAVQGSKGNTGNKYRVVVSNGSGSVTSNEVRLLVRWGPEAAWVTPAEGVDLVCPIATLDATCLAYFGTSVTSSGSATITWDRSSDGGQTWIPVPGDVPANTGEILKTTVGKARDNDLYRMTATNAEGSTTLTKRLRVGVPPTVAKAPWRVSAAAGSTATFIAEGATPEGYTTQWSHGTSSLAMVDIPGATSNTLTHVAHGGTEAAKVTFTNAYGSASAEAILSVLPAVDPPGLAPYFTTFPPATASVDVGQSISLTASAGGDPASVQWYQIVNTTTTAIPGATSPTLVYSPTSTALSSVRLVPEFTNAFGTTSAVGTTVTIRYAPYATAGDSTKIVSLTSAGGQISTTINGSVTGSPNPTWSWERSTDGGTTWSPIAGAIGSNYITPIGMAQQGYKYRVTGTNALGTTVGPVVTLNVGVRPTITSLSPAVTTPANTTASFTVVPNSLTPYSLIWERSPTSGGTYTAIPSCADQLTCSFTAVPADDGSSIRVRIVNDYNSATSAARLLTVTPTAPLAPSGVSATPGPQRATVTWSAPPNDGGSAVTGYVITPIRAGVPQPATTVGAGATSATLTGLTPAVPYAFTVAAVNALGTGPASAPSSAVIPISNRAPVAADQSIDAPRRVLTAIALGALDEDLDPLAYAVTTQPTKGTVTCSTAGSCAYRSDPGATGSDSFGFSVDDGRGETDTAIVTISLVNTAPVADDGSADAPRRQPTLIPLSATDANGDLLTYSIVTSPSKGTVSCGADLCAYTSAPGESGTDSFTFSVDDGNGGIDTGTVAITLTNSDPSAASASYSVTRGIAKSFELAGSDPNGDPLTYHLATMPTRGTLSCGGPGGGSCTYTATDVLGSDAFTFIATDPSGASSGPATVVIDIALPKVSIGDAQVLEPDAGTMGVFVPISLAAPLPTDVTIRYYTVSGTATGGTTAAADYRTIGSATQPQAVKIPAGQTWTTASVTINGETVVEPDETFELRIQSITAGDGSAVQVRDATATVTIVDNYRPSSDPLMMVADTMVYEGDAARSSTGFTRAQIVLQISKPTTAPITLTYRTVDGTAIGGAEGAPGKDYKAVTGSMVLPAGAVGSRVIDVLILGDTVSELDEDLRLQVVVPDGAPLVQKKSTGTAIILNDD